MLRVVHLGDLFTFVVDGAIEAYDQMETSTPASRYWSVRDDLLKKYLYKFDP